MIRPVDEDRVRPDVRYLTVLRTQTKHETSSGSEQVWTKYWSIPIQKVLPVLLFLFMLLGVWLGLMIRW